MRKYFTKKFVEEMIMDIIELTRELGKAIQADPRYVEMQLARQQSDEDQELQEAIGEFNLKIGRAHV